jgi:hypothetical protein
MTYGRHHRRLPRRRHGRKRWLVLPAAALALIFAFAGVAMTSANTIQSGGHTSWNTQSVTPTDLEPAFCYDHGIRPTAIVIVHNATGSGGNASELVIGDATRAHTISGGGGNDCVLAGAGYADTTQGDNGTEPRPATTDVCMGTHLEDHYTNDCEYVQAWPY